MNEKITRVEQENFFITLYLVIKKSGSDKT